jgi:hypothetical protein
MPPPPDPVRAKSLHLRRQELRPTTGNRYFFKLYRDRALGLRRVSAAEHTGQVPANLRIEREDKFKTGELPILFCSPTMELGVDIRDLAVVHLRNIPPTPANYAQRSGGAGRGGRPALVLAFSTYGNAHDHHFFRDRQQMIAGAVAPPRLDLANKDLVEAHLRSVWMSFVGMALKSSIAEVLDLGAPGFPLRPEYTEAAASGARRLPELVETLRGVAKSAEREIADAPWYSEAWIEEVARAAPAAFDAAFDRWRELYRAACEQRDAARRIIDDPALRDRRQREAAEQREREARREIELLLNGANRTEADFYTYRYLANEGFIPGYNFPRLPIRALVAGTSEAHCDRSAALSRPYRVRAGQHHLSRGSQASRHRLRPAGWRHRGSHQPRQALSRLRLCPSARRGGGGSVRSLRHKARCRDHRVSAGPVRAADGACQPMAAHLLRGGGSGARGLSGRHLLPLPGSAARPGPDPLG